MKTLFILINLISVIAFAHGGVVVDKQVKSLARNRGKIEVKTYSGEGVPGRPFQIRIQVLCLGQGAASRWKMVSGEHYCSVNYKNLVIDPAKEEIRVPVKYTNADKFQDEVAAGKLNATYECHKEDELKVYRLEEFCK